MKNPLKFIQEVKQETFRITWPTKKDTMMGAVMVFAELEHTNATNAGWIPRPGGIRRCPFPVHFPVVFHPMEIRRKSWTTGTNVGSGYHVGLYHVGSGPAARTARAHPPACG